MCRIKILAEDPPKRATAPKMTEKNAHRHQLAKTGLSAQNPWPGQRVIWGVAVEKLNHQKMAKKTLH